MLPVTAVTPSKWSGGPGSAIPRHGVAIPHFWMGGDLKSIKLNLPPCFYKMNSAFYCNSFIHLPSGKDPGGAGDNA